MKKAALIISTLALAFAPVAAFAQQYEGNQGYGNIVDENVSNDLTQTQVGIEGFSVDPQIQTSVQTGQNIGVIVGEDNVINQSVDNSADQYQSDFEFPPYSY